MPVAVPGRTHDAAREVQLDVIDAILDLLPDRADKAVRAVALERMSRRQEMTARGRQEVAGGEHTRTHVLTRLECALPGHVHEVRGAGTPHRHDPRLRECLHQAMAEGDGLIDGADASEIVGMNVDVPESGQEVHAVEIDHVRNLANPSSLDHDAAANDR